MVASPTLMASPLPRLKRALTRRGDEFLRRTPWLRRWRIDTAANAAELRPEAVAHLGTISPADPHADLVLTPRDQQFLKVCKYYQDGHYSRPEVFVCDVPDAYVHVGTGLVCTRDFVALNESQMAYRMEAGPVAVGAAIYRPFRWFKPRRPRRLSGTYATISNIYMAYWGHWLFDCLPRLHSLQQASGLERVTLLVADDWPASKYDSLECVLPDSFEVMRLPPDSWVQVERMRLASYATGRANNHMPREFYDFVREGCFRKCGLPLENAPRRRIFVSRAQTQHRRITNEPQLMVLLRRYGFESVALENLDFRRQVALFHEAEVVIAVDGSSCANIMFAGPIKVLLLYANQEPNTHWFTAAKGLGQEHYFWAAPGDFQHHDFTVDLAAIEEILSVQMGLQPVGPGLAVP